MPRKARKDLNTPFIHVMVQGINKEYIFKNKEYIESYLDFIDENKLEYALTIMTYCIMNNHAHFLVPTEDIEKFMDVEDDDSNCEEYLIGGIKVTVHS